MIRCKLFGHKWAYIKLQKYWRICHRCRKTEYLWPNAKLTSDKWVDAA